MKEQEYEVHQNNQGIHFYKRIDGKLSDEWFVATTMENSILPKIPKSWLDNFSDGVSEWGHPIKNNVPNTVNLEMELYDSSNNSFCKAEYRAKIENGFVKIIHRHTR